MGNFKRYDGYVMHIPQEFIDSKLPVCPFCKSDNPHWLLGTNAEAPLDGGRTYYQCERCQAIMSSTTVAAENGAKKQSMSATYMCVDTLGLVCTDTSLMGKEFPITYFQEMAAGAPPVTAVSEPTPVAKTTAEPMVISPVRFVGDSVSQKSSASENPVTAVTPTPQPATAPTPQSQLHSPSRSATASILNKGPFISLVLIAISALYTLVTMFSQSFAMMFSQPSFAVFFISELLAFIPYVPMVLGLLLRKKDGNYLFSVSFLVYAVTNFISIIIILVHFVLIGADFFVYASSKILDLFGLIPMALIGFHYLSGKLKTLKIICVFVKLLSDFLNIIGPTIKHPHISSVLAFLFGTVCLMVGVLIYNPGKKEN